MDYNANINMGIRSPSGLKRETTRVIRIKRVPDPLATGNQRFFEWGKYSTFRGEIGKFIPNYTCSEYTYINIYIYIIHDNSIDN